MVYEFEANDDYEVVWSGGELLPPREQKPDHTWTQPKRLYHPTGASILGEKGKINGREEGSEFD